MTEKSKRIGSGPYPYLEDYGAFHALPEQGLAKDKALRQLKEMAEEEDAFWQTGLCSGTKLSGY